MTSRTKTEPLQVICLECNRRFKTCQMIPECPKCGGVDIDLDDTSPTAGGAS